MELDLDAEASHGGWLTDGLDKHLHGPAGARVGHQLDDLAPDGVEVIAYPDAVDAATTSDDVTGRVQVSTTTGCCPWGMRHGNGGLLSLVST